jgi:hypothetical protein
MSKDWKDMTDEEFEIWSKGQYIDPIRVEIPKQISEIPDYDFSKFDRPSRLSDKQRQALKKFNKKQNRDRRPIQEKAMEAILTKVWQFIRDVFLQWVYPFAIYKKDEFNKPIIDKKTGKFEINWVATVTARALSLIVATWGTMELLGMSVAEWVARISAALGL